MPQALFFVKKRSKILENLLDPFLGQNFGPFFGFFFDFISKKHVFSAGGVAAGAFFVKKKGPKFWAKFWTLFFEFFGVWFFCQTDFL